jgi:hypothetical protein
MLHLTKHALVCIVALVAGEANQSVWAAASIRPDLEYRSATEFPRDLVAFQDTREMALIADLRFAVSDEAGAASFLAWLHGHTRAGLPVYLILNGSTSGPLRDALVPEALPSGVISLAPIGVRADIAVQVDRTAEDAARAALSGGVPFETLISGDLLGKLRIDESAIVQNRNSSRAGRTVPGESGLGSAAEPRDPLLQRAVQLHMGLKALGRIR